MNGITLPGLVKKRLTILVSELESSGDILPSKFEKFILLDFIIIFVTEGRSAIGINKAFN
jgi:p-aminobenzoyl-glutamate transporter AbgT